MKPRARKQWNGGVIPERSEIDNAWVRHMIHCVTCKENPMLPCDEGRKLYAELQAQYALLIAASAEGGKG